MQIKSNIDNHLEKFVTLPTTKAMLLFGHDAGMINFRLDNIKKNARKEGYELIFFSYSEIKNDLSVLSAEANEVSLFARKKIIFLTLSSGVIKKELTNIISENTGSNIVIIGGDLSTKSELRKLFETSENIFSYGCYAFSPYEREKFAENYVKTHSLKVPLNTIKKTAMLLEDISMLIGELEKLNIYFLGSNDANEPEELIFSFGEYSFLEFAYAHALHDKKKLIREYYKACYAGVAAVSLIRVLINFYTRIYIYKLHLELSNEQTAMMKISPPVFFKEKNDFIKVNNSKNLQLIVDKIFSLNKMELLLKSGLVENEGFFLNFLLYDDEIGNLSILEGLSLK